ncbi:MAG TPA: PAS domain-containing protein [Aestuariivirga sp.]
MLVNDNTETSQADSQIMHPGSRALFRFWEKIRAENAAPSRNDLDLRQISDIVPNLVILDRDFLHQTYKWRLAGSETCLLYRQQLTNTDALKGWGGFERNTLKQAFDTVVTSLQPCLVRFRLTTDRDQVIGAELLGLPIHARNGLRFHIFGGVFPYRDISGLGYDGITHRELSSTRNIWTEPLPGDKLVASLRGASTSPGGLRLIKGGRP